MPLDLNNYAPGPLIPANTNYDTSSIHTLSADSIEMNSLSEGTIIFRDGTISGLDVPVDPSDAVPRSYIQGAVPNGPSGSIQYNNNAIFGGSSSLLYSGSSTVATLTYNYGLYTSGSTTSGRFSDGYLTFQNSYIYDLQNISDDTSAVNKKYVDFIRNRNSVTYEDINTSKTYNSEYVLNGTIRRTMTSNVTDLLPTAESMMNYINTYFGKTTSNTLAVVGTSFECIIINESSNVLTINGNTDVTFDASTVIIPPSYCAKLTLVITNVTTPAFTVHIDSLINNITYINYLVNSSGFNTTIPIGINDNLLVPGPTTSGSTSGSASTSAQYTVSDVNKGIILRDPTGNSLDTLSDLQINTSLVIQNFSTFGITISDVLSSGTWIFRPTGSIVVPSGHSVLTYLNYNNGTNYMSVISNTSMDG